MKIAVRYQSRGGNTRAVAQTIAKTLGVTAEPIDVPLDGAVDILFVGGGMYFWTIDKKLEAYLNALTPDSVKSVAAFTTGGTQSGTGKIASILKERGIEVKSDCLKFKTMKNYHLFGGEGELKLTQKEIDQITEFAKKASGVNS